MGENIIRMLMLGIRFIIDPTSERSASDSIARFAQTAMRQLRAIGEVAATIAFDRVVQNLLEATSQAEDTAFKFENIYGNLSDAQAAWADEFADTYKRSATKVKESLATIQHEMLGFTKAGTDSEKRNVAELSKAIEEAGLNLGAFYGMDSKTAINTLISATEGSEGALDTFQAGSGRTLVANQQQAMRELVSEGSIANVSYTNLTPYERALVNLRTVLNANKDATDALARSQGNYSTMQENLQESLQELREVLGEFFLPTAKKIVDFLIRIVRGITNVVEAIKKFTDWLGITEDAVNILALAIAVMTAMGVARWLLGIVNMFRTLVSAAGAATGAVGTFAGTVGAVVAIALVLLAIIQDLNKFLRGEESRTGGIIESFGLDAEKCIPIVEGLRNVIIALTAAFVALRIASIITGTALMATPIGWIIAGIAALIAILVVVIKHWDDIKKAVSGVIESIRARIKESIDNLKARVSALFNWFKENASKIGDIALIIISVFTGPIGIILLLIKHLDKVKEVFGTIVSFVREKIKGAIDWVRNAVQSVFDWFKDKLNKIPDWVLILSSLFLGPIAPILLLIKHFDKLKEVAQKAWEWVKKVFGGGKENRKEERESGTDIAEGMAEGMESASKKEAVKSGADIADGMAEGMDSGKTTLAASAEDMAETIADYDHFSVPKKGPLSDFDESMPDMIDMMAAGMEKGKEKVSKAASGLAGEVESGFGDRLSYGKNRILQGATKLVDTISNITGGLQVSLLGGLANLSLFNRGASEPAMAMASGTYGATYRITQNVTFNQEFKGAEAMERKIEKAAEESKNDMTGFLAKMFGNRG